MSGINKDEKMPEQVEEMILKKEGQSLGELITALIFLVFGLFVFLQGWKMPREEITHDPEAWYSVPGFFPIIIGALLMLFCGILITRIIKQGNIGGNIKFSPEKLLKNKVVIRTVIALMLLIVYIVILKYVHYAIITFLFLFSSMMIFREEKYSVWKILVISVITTAALTYGFGTLAKIPLP